MGIKIFTDSTSDLTSKILSENNISVVPLYVILNEKSYKDSVDLKTDELFDFVTKYNKLPKTSAPTPDDFYNAFKPYIDNNDDIIYIGLSSLISSTIQNAHIAANQFPEGRVEIIDSFNLSSGIGLLVMKAVDFSKTCNDIHKIAESVRELVPRVRTAFIIDTLDYLYLGGRCSALKNFFGQVFKIRPVIGVVDGEMILKKKLRGKRSRALEALLSDTIKDKENIDMTRIMITHSKSTEDSVYLKKELEKNLTSNFLITEAGCVISSHCGPNTIGILYIEK